MFKMICNSATSQLMSQHYMASKCFAICRADIFIPIWATNAVKGSLHNENNGRSSLNAVQMYSMELAMPLLVAALLQNSLDWNELPIVKLVTDLSKNWMDMEQTDVAIVQLKLKFLSSLNGAQTCKLNELYGFWKPVMKV